MSTTIMIVMAYLGVFMLAVGFARLNNWVKKLKGASFKRHVTFVSVLLSFIVSLVIMTLAGSLYLNRISDSTVMIPSNMEEVIDIAGAVLMLLLAPYSGL